MGSRRRPSHIHTAAALQPSRLPLGTPTSSQPSLPRSLIHTASFSSSSSFEASEAHPPTNPGKSISTTNKPSRMAVANSNSNSNNKNSSEPASNHKSIADAKLERQRKRIEDADAALRAPSNPGGKKQAKPSTNDLDGPVSEVRISSIRVVSRESSLARPLSVLSHDTTDTAVSEPEAVDGFQTILGRRNRKDGLNARGDKSEPRQATVEAIFDTRDIYEAFGNALPTPEYIEENPGSKDGQLQFIQHPNGDVSAHQWSNNRYMWENIGQFSNIRKRVEGQLAVDRLKGETAHQTLQQNTLTYFRTIAKQREAHVMGLPFGPKEIQAVMPAPPPSDGPAASTGLNEPSKGQPMPAPPQALSSIAVEAVTRPTDDLPITLNASSLFALHSQQLPQYRATESIAYIPNHAQQMVRHPEDPFYSASPYERIYGGYPQYVQQYYNPVIPNTVSSGGSYGAMTLHQLNYDFHFPPPSATSRSTQPQPSRPQVAQTVSQANTTPQPAAPGTAYALSGSQQPPYQSISSYTAVYPPASNHTTAGHDFASVPPRPDTHLGIRASMSDQLWKISETAKERNLSQTSIGRTVLYDPYQKQSSVSTTSRSGDIERINPSPGLSTSIAQPSPNSAPFQGTPSHFFPIPLDSEPVTTASSSMRQSVSNALQDSSPDAYWSKKPYDHSTPLTTSVSKPQGTPQNFEGPFFPADKRNPSVSSSAGKKSYDEELNDWWTSGNKFARQEEFYQSIAAAQKAAQSTTSSLAAHLPPIGGPSIRTPVKHATHPFNPNTTRLLIPVLENLASYVQGPMEKRRDYFSQWSPALEWAIDRSESGNNSFYDADWGQPPARVGRDPRYSGRLSWSAERMPPATGRFPSSFAAQGSGYALRVAGAGGLDRRFGRFS